MYHMFLMNGHKIISFWDKFANASYVISDANFLKLTYSLQYFLILISREILTKNLLINLFGQHTRALSNVGNRKTPPFVIKIVLLFLFSFNSPFKKIPRSSASGNFFLYTTFYFVKKYLYIIFLSLICLILLVLHMQITCRQIHC